MADWNGWSRPGARSGSSRAAATHEQQVEVTAGDVLFFYTDGCVEAENASGDIFGSERLELALATSAGLGADQVMVAVESEVSRFRSGVERH